MMNNQKQLQHFILTRFNILLWQTDKEGCKVRTIEWLEHRFFLFEQYCFSSIKRQTCKDFYWIVLFDSKTPERYKKRVAQYQQECPQLIPGYVEPENGRLFAQIFRAEVLKRLKTKRVITTYLDNDDALDIHFIEDLQNRVMSLADGTFVYYSDGYQFYTDYNYLMKIHYPRNHFVSVVEKGESSILKTIYGFGSHYYIDKMEGAKIEYVENHPMWCEVIHEKNMGNDAYFFSARMMRDEGRLRQYFGVDVVVRFGVGLYLWRFMPRYIKTFIRRTKYFLFGRQW